MTGGSGTRQGPRDLRGVLAIGVVVVGVLIVLAVVRSPRVHRETLQRVVGPEPTSVAPEGASFPLRPEPAADAGRAVPPDPGVGEEDGAEIAL